MKKISFFLLFVTMFAMAGAQNINQSVSKQNGKTNIAEFKNIILVGEQNGKTIGVTNRYTSLLGKYIKKECKVVAFDNDMNISGTLDIPKTKDHENLAATLYNGKVYILTRRSDRSEVVYERFVVDPTTMQLSEEPTVLYRYTSQRKDDNYYWANQSPDGMLTGLIHITTNRKNDKFEAVEFLLDEEMKVEWQQEYPIYSLSHLIVTNDGELVTIGNDGAKTGTRSNIYISILDADNAIDMSETLNVTVTNNRLISYSDGKVLATGFGVNTRNTDDIQYFGIAADNKLQQINVSYKSLTDNEKNVFVNRNYGSKPKTPATEAMIMRHYEPTEFGGVCTIHIRWNETICNQNGCRLTAYQEGVLIYGIDKDGEIIWHHPIRSSSKEKNSELTISSSLCVDGNNVYFFQSESPKWPQTYNMDKKLKTFVLNNGSKNIGVYRINSDGKITKNVLTLAKKNVLSCSLQRNGEKYTGFLSTGKGVSRIDIKF